SAASDRAVAPLAAGVVDDDGHHTVHRPSAQTFQHPRLRVLRERRRAAQVEPELGPGVRPVGVLATRSAGRPERPRELRAWDHPPGDLEVVPTHDTSLVQVRSPIHLTHLRPVESRAVIMENELRPGVDFALLADAVQVLQGKLYVLGGGWNTL